MIINCANGATVVINECHWIEGAYLSVTHAGGAGTVLNLADIRRVQRELASIEAAIVARHEVQSQRETA